MSRASRPPSIFLVLLMMVAGCGDVSDGATGTYSTAEPARTDEQSRQDPDGDDWQSIEIDDLIYGCDGIQLPLDQLMALGSLPSPEASAFDRATAAGTLGDRDRWAQLAPALLVDRTPLMSDPPGLMVALNDDAPQACIATLDSEDQPVAWRVETITTSDEDSDGTDAEDGEGVSRSTVSLIASIESCVDPDEVVTQVAAIDDGVIVTLSLPSGTVSEEMGCAIDGSKRIDVELPADFDGEVFSSRTWPFIQPNPDSWVTLSDAPLVTSIVPSDLNGVLCTASSEVGEVQVGWWDVPGGVAIEIMADGELLTSAGRSKGKRSYHHQLDAAYMARLANYSSEASTATAAAVPDVMHSTDGQPGPDRVFSLFGAPPEPGSFYELRLSAPGATVTVPCGYAGTLDASETAGCGSESTATDPAESVEPECIPAPVADPSQGQLELDEAKELFNRTAFGAHVYVTLVVDGESVERYIDPGRSFSPPRNERLLNPFTLHDELIAAIADGQSVEYQLDPASGIPTTWAVDGTERQLLCLEVDTAPPSLRQTDCDPSIDLIGG